MPDCGLQVKVVIASGDDALCYRFQGWELRPATRLLVVNGNAVGLGARAFDLLVVLAERRERVVGKEELLSTVWAGRVVEENNISVHIAALRRVLGPAVISTVPGIGYRLTAEPEPQPETMPQRSLAVKPTPTRHPSGLFGRDDDIERLLALVARHPIVNVTGPGGVGKTSLARAVTRLQSDNSPLTCWVDLSPLRPGDGVLARVATEVGVVGTASDTVEDLLAALSRTRAWIILDNCEHLASEVAELIAATLQSAARVRWLLTSQAPLHLPGECVYQLAPLQIPEAGASFPEALRSGAVAMLHSRTAAAYRPFELTPANIDAAIEVCRELDGLPLAIEMVATRIATLGIGNVREQLKQRLRLSRRSQDGPARHQTLRHAFDWSCGLLSTAEQCMFRGLHPFVGGFTARMAVRLLGHEGDLEDGPKAWEALEALSTLVERSLVHRAADDGRYFLFESARAYALELQTEFGEVEHFRRRHALVTASVFATARTDHDRMRDADWAAKYLPEKHNVRAALAWASRADDPDLLARLVAACAQIDTFSRNQADIVHSDVSLDMLMRADARWRATACLELSWAHFLDGSRKTGTALARQALDDFKSLDDTTGIYQSLAQLVRLYESRPGMMAAANQAAAALADIDEEQVPLRCRLFRAITGGMQYAGDRTVERLQELHDLAVRSGFDTLSALCRVHITDQLLIDGRFEDMVSAARRFDAAAEPRPRVRATILANLVFALIQLGRVSEAAEPARIVMRTLPSATFHLLAAFALAAVRQCRFDDAAMMLGYSDRVRRERDQRADPAEAAVETEIAQALAQSVPERRLRELRHFGSAFSLEEAWRFLP